MSDIGQGAAVGGAVAQVGGLFGIGAGRQRRNQEKLMEKQASIQYKYQQQAAEAEYNRSQEAWRMNNEYNLPSNERKRLEDAGLLGASLFSGSSAGSPSQAPSVSTPGGPSVGIPGSDELSPGASVANRRMSVLSSLSGIVNTNTDSDLKQSQMLTQSSIQDLNATVSSLNLLMGDNVKVKTDIERISLFIADKTKNWQVDLSEAELNVANSTFHNLVMQAQVASDKHEMYPLEARLLRQNIAKIAVDMALSKAQASLAKANTSLSQAEAVRIGELIKGQIKDNTLKDYDITKANFYVNGLQYRDSKGNVVSHYPPMLSEGKSKDYGARITEKTSNWFETMNITQMVDVVGGIVFDAVAASKGFKSFK